MFIAGESMLKFIWLTQGDLDIMQEKTIFVQVMELSKQLIANFTTGDLYRKIPLLSKVHY